MSEGRRTELAAKGLLLFAVAFIAFFYGLLAARFDLPPAPTLLTLPQQLTDFAHHWRNDLGIEPSRHLVKPPEGPRAVIAMHDAEAVGAGPILVTGLTPQRPSLNSAVLYDPAGEELHVWPLDYDTLKPDAEGSLNVFAHGLLPMPDGSVIVNFDAGSVLARVGACGEVLWTVDGYFHHAISRAPDGTIWTLRGEAGLVQVRPEDGKVLQEIDLVEDVMRQHGHQGVLAIRSDEDAEEIAFSHDPFHLNAVRVLPPEMADAFPLFEPGDILFSLRNLNLVGVLDRESYDLKWSRIGPWHRQHDPHFLPDGRIMVYDNNMAGGQSRILAVDPADGRTEALYQGTAEAPFYSWRRGKQHRLPGGDLLIVESERGRAFIAQPDGRIVWEFNNVYDEAWNGVVADAVQLPADFFAPGALTCSAGDPAPPA